MEYLFIPTPTFEKSYKLLKKKYPSLQKDIEDFKKEFSRNPNIGDDLGAGFRKVRIAITSKNKGKSGGARIITYDLCIKEVNKTIILVELYDKSDVSTISRSQYKTIIAQFFK
jgi:hypothetical protein